MDVSSCGLPATNFHTMWFVECHFKKVGNPKMIVLSALFA